jgi:hypothetical protein
MKQEQVLKLECNSINRTIKRVKTMQSNIQIQDSKLKVRILRRVILGTFIIGLIQLIITIFAHKSSTNSLLNVVGLVIGLGIAYLYVAKFKRVNLVGRVLIYGAVPVLIYRAHMMGGAWGVTTNWIYLVPVFASLFFKTKELVALTIYITILMIALGYFHTIDPIFAINQLQLVPVTARIFYLLMPMFVIAYIVNFNERQKNLL